VNQKVLKRQLFLGSLRNLWAACFQQEEEAIRAGLETQSDTIIKKLNSKTENPTSLQRSWKKAKLNQQPTTNLPHECPKTSMTRRSLSFTPFLWQL